MSLIRSILRSLGKHKFGSAVFLIILLAFTVLAFPGHSSADYGDETWDGYFKNNQETTGLPVINGGISSSVNSASEFINLIVNGQYGSSDDQKHTAGAFIILTFLGYPSGTPKSKVDGTMSCNGGPVISVIDCFKKNVNDYANASRINWFWTTPSDYDCTNTFYQPINNDVADYNECSHTQNQSSIAFFNPDDPSEALYVIRRSCGNPIGDSGGVQVVNKVPTGSLQLCVGGVAGTARVKGSDPDHPAADVAYKVVHFSTDEYDFGGTTSASGVDRNGLALYPGRDYRLMVKDLDDDIYYDIDPVVTYPSSCGAVAASPDCSVFNRTLQPHSAYRFVVFPKDQDYAPSDPSPNPAVFVGSHPGWASYNNPTSPFYGQAAEWFYTNSDDSTYNYSNNFPPPTGPDWVIYSERWQHYDANGNGTLDSWTYARARIAVSNCYSARVTDGAGNCTISIDPNVDGTGNGVKAGSTFTAHAIITNTGKANLSPSLGGNNLTLTGDGDFPIGVGKPTPLKDIGALIPPGGSVGIDFELTAPASIGNYNLSGYPDYWQRTRLGGSCSFNVAVYEPFNVAVHARGDLNPTVENPTEYAFRTWIEHKSGPAANINITGSSAYRQGSPAYAFFAGMKTSNTPNGNEDTVISGNPDPRPVGAGDKFCVDINAEYTTGFVGPGGPGDVHETSDPGSDSQPCDEVHNEPYFHVLGSDVSAGGGFGVNCSATPGNGGIHAYTRTSGNQPAGSGGQAAALALDRIFGFSSASLRTAEPTGSLGLSMSNTANNIGGPANSPALGGLLGTLGSNSCVPDYFATKPADQTLDAPATDGLGRPTINLSAIDGRHYYEPNGGTLYMTASAGIANGRKLVIYVKGNVVLQNSSFIFTGSANYGAPENVPVLYIIAKGGNIYVDKGLAQLDGAFIAQPNGGAGGNIYSCASGTTALSGLSDCRTQLVVNGSFTANRVYLSRTFGSIRDSLAAEYLGKAPLVRACSDSGNTLLGDCAGEIFNFSPETYLAQPPFPPSSGPTTGKYKYFTSLPAIL